MNGTTGRAILGSIAATLLAFALIWLAQLVGNQLFPDMFDPASDEVLIPAGATVALCLGWFGGSFAGGWLVARIANSMALAWLVGGCVMGASLYRAATMAEPLWLMALAVLLPLAGAALAGRSATSLTS